MKYFFLSAALLLINIASFAQRIHFSDPTNHWTSRYYFCSVDTGYFAGGTTDYFIGDTTIYGKVYQKIFHNDGAGGNLFVREDTLAKKVYLRGVNDTGDNVLYDYTLGVGDTFYIDTSSPARTTYYVASIDSVHINTLWYKVWHFQLGTGHPNGGPTYTVIEGIGSDVHPLYPLAVPANIETCINLTCFSNRGTAPVVSPEVDGYFDNNSSCASGTTGMTNNTENKATINIYPNPIDQSSKIVCSYNISSGSLQIVNEIGKTIINTSFHNQDELPIGDLINMPGIYFYGVRDNLSGKIFTGRFIY